MFQCPRWVLGALTCPRRSLVPRTLISLFLLEVFFGGTTADPCNTSGSATRNTCRTSFALRRFTGWCDLRRVVSSECPKDSAGLMRAAADSQVSRRKPVFFLFLITCEMVMVEAMPPSTEGRQRRGESRPFSFEFCSA